MKPIAFCLALLGLVAFTGAAHAGEGCPNPFSGDDTAETPLPLPAPTTGT